MRAAWSRLRGASSSSRRRVFRRGLARSDWHEASAGPRPRLLRADVLPGNPGGGRETA